ncbi:McrB family protein [Thermoflexibacter ruber]|uniref:5-methylcytosine-specific restriction enzyme B n=1 Tax=Thermoflexibacter ruber TaxID=1003 RepID=A0A1I2J230_9BACT|nr:AAA family ATPase [Thermoflexibacter ruber]SFF47006.1 5-methylcytosine-specific restriction enzyme B [Thermoflexibacter ruber]
MEIHSKNLIYYGASGTGKTYQTVVKALEIITGTPTYDQNLYEHYRKLGQIEFVSFHQSFSYHEFVEGISAETQGKHIRYFVKDGIFKLIAQRALENQQLVSQQTDLVPFEKVFDVFMSPIFEGEQEKIEVKMRGKSFFVVADNGDTIDIENHARNPYYSLSKKVLRERYLTGSLKTDKRYAHWYNFLAIELLKIAKKFQEERKKVAPQNFVLIIDEINRANISKVFGELITLIEDSKRLWASEAKTVRLPYSHDEFGVPQNLYLIGSMNTSDRSIAQLDIALRRRFVFIEMPSTPALLKGKIIEGIDLERLLTKINERIIFLANQSQEIGHTYFYEVNTIADLAQLFTFKIIPLLQEYFYDQWEKIALVLSNKYGECEFLQKKNLKAKDLFKKNIDNLKHEKATYQTKNWNELLNNQIYKEIYE